MHHQPTRKKQRGFLLESLGLVLLILSILALIQMNKKLEDELDDDARRLGQALTTASNFASDYMTTYSEELLTMPDMNSEMTVTTTRGTVVIEHGDSPTIQNLIDLGKALPNMSPTAFSGGNYRIKISRANNCSGTNCNLQGLIYIDKPYSTNGGQTPDFPRLGIAARVIGADGGFSTYGTPQLISGYRNNWSTTNLVPSKPGILAARFGDGSSSQSWEYYKRDGTRTLTGDLAGGNRAIKDITNINASGKITGATFNSKETHSVGEGCSPEENHSFGSSNLGTMMVCLDDRWRYVKHNPARLDDPCSADGITGTSIDTDETLICRESKFVSLNKFIGRRILVSREEVWDEKPVKKPPCVGGQADYSITPIHTMVDLTQEKPRELFEMRAISSGEQWIVKIKVIDTDGVQTDTSRLRVKAVMNLECTY